MLEVTQMLTTLLSLIKKLNNENEVNKQADHQAKSELIVSDCHTTIHPKVNNPSKTKNGLNKKKNSNRIKFSKRFERKLLDNQDILLFEEISRQHNMILSIQENYQNYLDTNEKKAFFTIKKNNCISISDKSKPTLLAIINQNNQIDATLKKINQEKNLSRKKKYLKSFINNEMNTFIWSNALRAEPTLKEDDSNQIIKTKV